MVRLYVYISCVAVCVASIIAVPHVTVSAPVGSTVALPCNLTKVYTQTSAVQWRTDDEFVFERSIDGVNVGPGYEGRVDVPEDELHKGNCSLVLKNVSAIDDGSYRSFVVEHVDRTNPNQRHEIVRVTLSVNDSNSVDPPITVSASVGSTVVLPCELGDLSTQKPHVEWNVGPEVVFERKGKTSYQGKRYEGRVDVAEDELRKGNCSLVLKNVSVSDEGVYKSSMLVKRTKKAVQKVQLSVKEQTEETSDSSGKSGNSKDKISDNNVSNRNHWFILVISPVMLLCGVIVWFLIRKKS